VYTKPAETTTYTAQGLNINLTITIMIMITSYKIANNNHTNRLPLSSGLSPVLPALSCPSGSISPGVDEP
jgi:hypothetical protein